MKDVIHAVVDDGYYTSSAGALPPKNMVEGRTLDGRSVGIVATIRPMLAGTLDINASIKGARFVRFATASISAGDV